MSESQRAAIKIMLVQRHSLVRNALREMIDAWAGHQIVAEVGNQHDALAQAAQAAPDIILVDTDMDGDNVLDLLPALQARVPAAYIILLTDEDNRALGLAATRRGVRGLVLKDQPAAVLQSAIARVVAGEFWLDATLLAELLGAAPTAVAGTPIATLSERERAVIALVARGLSNRQIAAQLMLSDRIIAHQLTAIFRKLGLSSRLELVIYAYQHGLA